eukprot:6618870-Prymnesium_polylepis.1
MGPTPKCGHTHAGAVSPDTRTQTDTGRSEYCQARPFCISPRTRVALGPPGLTRVAPPTPSVDGRASDGLCKAAQLSGGSRRREGCVSVP